MAAGLLLVSPFGRKKQTQRTDKAAETEVSRPTNSPLYRRLWWKIRPPTDLMRVDGLVVDRSRKPHCAWLGPTGAGKSSAVAVVRVDGKRPTLIATPDVSDPLREATLRLGGFIWTACESTTPVDFLIGEPTEVAERLTEVFRSGGVGAWKRTTRRATASIIRHMDEDREPRSLVAIGRNLEKTIAKDRELKMICGGWVERFLDLSDQFGPSIGAGGVDIAEMLRAGRTVLLDNDAFAHRSLGGDVVALGLAEGLRCAPLLPKGYRLIFEEAGQLGDRIDLAEPFHRAGRRRKIALDDLTQAESDLVFHGNDGITANLGTRVYFAQELKSLQKVAADRLGLPYSFLDPASMQDFSAYVAHGKIRRLVRFPRPPKPSYVFVPTPSQPDSPQPRRTIVIEELSEPPEVLPGLPPPSLKAQEILSQLDRTGSCWLWLGKLDRDGYGIVHMSGNWKRVHRVLYELTYGPIPVGLNGRALDLDHRRTCPRHCGNPEHLEPVTRRVNVQRMHRTRGHVTAAD